LHQSTPSTAVAVVVVNPCRPPTPSMLSVSDMTTTLPRQLKPPLSPTRASRYCCHLHHPATSATTAAAAVLRRQHR
jgi:hypothetical protein